MNKLKGIILVVSICFASIMMPFNIYANSEIQIVPTWSQSAQQTQWANKFRVTNFCESSNNPQNYSCQLTITVNGDYYGYVYFDGYINNQIIFDYQTMFISGGKGTFYYTWYQNGLKEINKVNIAGLNLVSPTDDIDLTQIIDLLTSINSYNQQQVGNQSTQIQQLQTLINDLIISNGYLETITKLRQWNIPFESYSAVLYSLERYECIDYFNYYYINYPRFELTSNRDLFNGWFRSQSVNFIVLVFDDRIRTDNFSSYWQFSNNSLDSITEIIQWNGTFKGFSIKFTGSSSFNKLTYIGSINTYYVPIYLNYDSYKNVSTDFALMFGLTNQLLDDLHIIANGNNASNSASQQLDSDTSDFNTDRDDLIDIEDSMGNNMDSAMNQITPNNNGLSGFGGNFLTSAVWVRTQFERLTNNTPYGSLIVYGMTLGLALLLLGKVML